MTRARMLYVTATPLIAAAVLGGIWLTGRGNNTSVPEKLLAPTTRPTASPSAQTDPVAYRVCAEGYGWVRPSLDDQRRHLVSLGGEFRFLSQGSPPFQGAYTSGDGGKTNVWHYALFWVFVSDAKDEQSALVQSGLWSATPNTSDCDRSAGLTLLIEHRVTEVRFNGTTVRLTAREVSGYFQYIEYTLPADIRSVGYRLEAEDGTFIDACCT